MDETILVAIKVNGCAILAADSQTNTPVLSTVLNTDKNKTVKVCQNIHFGIHGDRNCDNELRLSLPTVDFSSIDSVSAAARLITDHINTNLSPHWGAAQINLLLVGNMIHTDGFHIFLIKKCNETGIYVMTEVNDTVIVIGCARATPALNEQVDNVIKAFLEYTRSTGKPLTPEHAFDMAYKVVRSATFNVWTVGGDIRIISFRKDYVDNTLLEQDDPRDCNSPYSTRTDTRDDPNHPNAISVTYRI